MVNRTVTERRLAGTDNVDTLRGIAQNNERQIHVYADDGADRIILDFANIDKFAHGHHVRGDRDADKDRYSDTFNFTNLGRVDDVIVGRFEDFEVDRDKLQIGGSTLSLSNLERGYGTNGGYSWRIVEYDADRRDDQPAKQQWLLIDTKGGYVFYALEGARVSDGKGASNTGAQEAHFVGAGNGHKVTASELKALKTVGYVDPQNYVPKGYSARDGNIINDYDANYAASRRTIDGGDGRDLIAAGLNNDRVEAGNGNDIVWGGSGNDTIYGQGGADSLMGGTGNDYISGGTSNDTIRGETGADRLYGNSGNDRIFGGANNDVLNGGGGDDRLYGGSGADHMKGGTGRDHLDGSSGNDSLYGNAGNDTLIGGSGRDVLNGGGENDVLRGGNDRDLLHGSTGNDVLTGGAAEDRFVFRDGWDRDRITDFNKSQDTLLLDNNLWSGSLSTSQVVSRFAKDTGSNVVFDFGGGDTLTLQGVGSISGLSDAIDII
ncbi:calcium-binding protein [Roseovarius nubinhibens]|uniref:calcium-binding protein n=1 Tax=Roseovarius nubinhibens TaxID=314263 RepID=UPI000325D6B4|nr:calcium-binding protein [Roseovarius nubinhibens]